MPALDRLPDWPERLADGLRSTGWRARHFAWGQHDCVTFAAHCAELITGQDLLAELRGQWTDRASAVRLLRRLGGMREAVTRVLGPELPTPALAWRGDLVLTSQGGKPALAVCNGAYAVGPGRGAIVRVPMSEGRAAWAVGHG